jgi:hypothetical protein
MMIIGCDLHTRYQQIAMLDTETGELVERRLEHENGEARTFYAALRGRVRVGIETTGHTHWFEACWRSWATSCGWEVRRRFGPQWCASRRRMRAMRRICWKCCAPTAFLRSGGPRQRSGIYDNWSGTGRRWK